MIKYNLAAGQVIISLATTDTHDSVTIEYEGDDEDLVELVRQKLESQCGVFGHRIAKSTTPIDLDAALKSQAMARFRPRIVEGAEIVKAYTSGVPKGALT